MKLANPAPGIFTIEGFLSPLECEELVQLAELERFEPAPIVSATGTRVQSDTRNNDRRVFDDPALATRLWVRASSCIPASMGRRSALGLNERFRLYRYTPGQRFTWHADAPFQRQNGEISLLTFMVYLNEGFGGGATRFESTKINPRVGLALAFEHGLIHEGAEVQSGVKYVLRTDVMFGAQAPGDG